MLIDDVTVAQNLFIGVQDGNSVVSVHVSHMRALEPNVCACLNVWFVDVVTFLCVP